MDDRGAGHVILIRRDDSLALDMSPSVVERLHVLWWEDPHSASTAPPPAQRAGAVKQVDDVAAAKVEVGLLCGHIVAEGVSQASSLQGGRDADRGEKERCQAEQGGVECHRGVTRCALPRLQLQTGERKSGRGNGGGPRGGTPGSSFCKGWGTGYMQAGAAGGGTAEGL